MSRRLVATSKVRVLVGILAAALALVGCGEPAEEVDVVASTSMSTTTSPQDASTTPCGRADCSTPSPDPAPCDGDAYAEAVARDIDGGIRLVGEARCDGSFLITDIDTGSGGCPPTEGAPSPCANVKTAYFVARDGLWAIVTYAGDYSCDDVAEATGIRFPEALCA